MTRFHKILIALIFNANFLLCSPSLLELKNFINNKKISELKKYLDINTLNTAQQKEALSYAELIERETEQNSSLSYDSKNLIFGSLILSLLGISTYKFLKLTDLSFDIDSMITINKRLNGKPGYLNPWTKTITNPIPESIIKKASKDANFLALQILLCWAAGFCICIENLTGYHTSKHWYILNFLRNKFLFQSPSSKQWWNS